MGASQEIQNTAEDAARNGENYVKEELEQSQKELSGFLKLNLFSISGKEVTTLTSPTLDQNYCTIEVTYNATFSTLFTHMLGIPAFPPRGKAMTSTNINWFGGPSLPRMTH